jgi:hypothetical protein
MFPEMEFKYSRHQVARSARPDADVSGKLYLIKNVQFLRATYQIRLLAFAAVERREKVTVHDLMRRGRAWRLAEAAARAG